MSHLWEALRMVPAGSEKSAAHVIIVLQLHVFHCDVRFHYVGKFDSVVYFLSLLYRSLLFLCVSVCSPSIYAVPAVC